MELNVNMSKMQKIAIFNRIAFLYKDKIDLDFSLEIFSIISEEFMKLIANTYNASEMSDYFALYTRLSISICENYCFDMQRFDIEITNEYKENFVGRIVAQMLYASLAKSIDLKTRFLQHPLVLIIISITNLLIDRMKDDIKTKDFPVFVSLNEAMVSLLSTYVLFNNNANSQALTVYRQYLEQLIIGITLSKNPQVYEKYTNHQRLTIKYAINSLDEDIVKLLSEKKIPARDVKSYLNYGWIEDIPGFSELTRVRYSIKAMAKLAKIEDIYELYSNTSNYVHMNYLYAEIDWTRELNNNLASTFFTLDYVMDVYSKLTNYDFIWNNIDLRQEFKSISSIFYSLLAKTKHKINIIN